MIAPSSLSHCNTFTRKVYQKISNRYETIRGIFYPTDKGYSCNHALWVLQHHASLVQSVQDNILLTFLLCFTNSSMSVKCWQTPVSPSQKYIHIIKTNCTMGTKVLSNIDIYIQRSAFFTPFHPFSPLVTPFQPISPHMSSFIQGNGEMVNGVKVVKRGESGEKG